VKYVFTRQAWEDYVSWQAADRQILKRINALMQDIARNGHTGIGKPEPLKGDLGGYWSRRIDGVNRLVYRLTETAGYTCEIYQCKGHYSD
jgi:toxin YoeB